MIGILDTTCVCIVISHLKKLLFLSDLFEFFFFFGCVSIIYNVHVFHCCRFDHFHQICPFFESEDQN